MRLYSLSPKRCLLQYPQSSEVITISSFLCLLRNMFYKHVCIQMFNMRAHTFFFKKGYKWNPTVRSDLWFDFLHLTNI